MIFKPLDIERLNIFVQKIFERGRLVKIEPVTVSRSLSQNAFSWLVFTYIGQETGNIKDDIYAFCLKRFPVFKEVDINGIIEVVPISLSQMDRDQNRKFIDEFTVYFRSEGYDVPDPESHKALEMYNYYKSKGLI